MPDPPISVLFRHPSPGVRRTKLRGFLKDLVARILPGQSVSCLITSDGELRELNRRFRGKDRATDVLSFPVGRVSRPAAGFSPPRQARSPVLPNELAISFERAKAQAAELGHDIETELRILMLHGLLHLAGMDHERDSGDMARAEARWRKRLGLPAGLIERATA